MLKQQKLRAVVQDAKVEAADKAIADFFYANAIPFSAASTEETSVFFQMVKAIKAAPEGYFPPNPKKLGNYLLDSCYL